MCAGEGFAESQSNVIELPLGKRSTCVLIQRRSDADVQVQIRPSRGQAWAKVWLRVSSSRTFPPDLYLVELQKSKGCNRTLS